MIHAPSMHFSTKRDMATFVVNIFLAIVMVGLLIWLILLVTGVTGPSKENMAGGSTTALALKKGKLAPPGKERALGLEKGTLAAPGAEKLSASSQEMQTQALIPGQNKFVYTEKIQAGNRTYHPMEGKTCDDKQRIMSMKGMVLDTCQAYCQHDTNCVAFTYNYKNGDCKTFNGCMYLVDGSPDEKLFLS